MSDPTKLNLAVEIQRTRPDYIVFDPKTVDRSTKTTGNEHLIVDHLPNGDLIAVWTQSSFEGEPDQHIVFSRSVDGGRSWSSPKTIVGQTASWAFFTISRSGRIYVYYNRHIGVNDVFTALTGVMEAIYSDDAGETWSAPGRIPMPKSIWDNPDPAVPANWVVWQRPNRLNDGRYFVGFSRWVSPKVIDCKVEWWAQPSVVEFIRFENVDDDPEISDLKLTFLMGDEKALQVPLRGNPALPVIQEPAIVTLPDGRLFAVMRTTMGSPYYAISEDQGESWSSPEPLRQYDDGPLLKQPLSPCPIYPFGDSFILFYHNNDGNFLQWGISDTHKHRRPICTARGEFRPGAKQPVWFSEPLFLMDHGGIPILRTDMALYASVTRADDGVVLWYPERKFFMLGRKITFAELADLEVKKAGA